jgi:hypothetical protein
VFPVFAGEAGITLVLEKSADLSMVVEKAHELIGTHCTHNLHPDTENDLGNPGAEEPAQA